MFDIGGTELLLIAVVALLVIGPKDLPRVLRVVGQYTGKARAMTRHLRSGFDEMLRQAELEEMEKKWADYNRKVMEQTPTVPDYAPPAPVAPASAPPDAADPEPVAETPSVETPSVEAPPAAVSPVGTAPAEPAPAETGPKQP